MTHKYRQQHLTDSGASDGPADGDTFFGAKVTINRDKSRRVEET